MVKQVNTKHTRSRITKWLTVLFLFMAAGTTVELYLLDHYEDFWQLVPLIVFGLTILIFIPLHYFQKSALKTVFVVFTGLSGLSGLLGIYFHIKANLEFEAELHPSLGFTDNLIAAFSGALPSLAPASMIVFALIGYIYYLHINN